MNIFSDMKLTRKLVILLLVVLAGFAIVGGAFYRVLKAEESAALNALRASQFGDLVDRVDIGVLNARRYEKDFQITKVIGLLEKFDASITAAVNDAAALSGFLEDEGAQTMAGVTEVLERYQTDFYTAVDAQIAVGLDPQSGILGDVHAIAKVLENAVGQVNNNALIHSMLLMERHIESFLSSSSSAYVDLFDSEYEHFLALLKQAKLTSASLQKISPLVTEFHRKFMELYGYIDEKDRAFDKVSATVDELQPLLASLLDIKQRQQATNWASINIVRQEGSRQYLVTLGATAVIVSVLILLYTRTFAARVRRIEATVAAVAQGNYGARTALNTGDELGVLSDALDDLLDERVAALLVADTERERLNASVIGLLDAVGKLSERDLTVRVPVSEDVTAPVADALNLLISETARVLYRVNMISELVNSSSEKVKAHSEDVVRNVQAEFVEVESMVDQLATVMDAMNTITALAQSADDASGKAMETMDVAVHAVDETVGGIQSVREVIRETEKRFKRLGERSQEIGGTVTLMNDIAERTHILALNASMHSAAGGESGRSFGLVADEVQRLADNARDATQKISTLVKNIQVETTDTVNTINHVIAQVVAGTTLAEQAGERMREARATTADLIESLQQIARSSQEQAGLNKRLHERTQEVLTTTRNTAEQLQEQSELSVQLLKCAQQLVSTVRVFKLPALSSAA